MCGITGFLFDPDAPGPDPNVACEAMTSVLAHRGPDDGDVWTDTAAGVTLGHRRLSIIDLSPEGHQPMASASGRWMLVYNGEIYNYRAIRRELEAAGPIAWRGHSDTEVLLAAIERWGVEGALERANGMFAIALWDRRDRTLYLARDRAGEKPLYYGWVGGAFVFGSELKALRAHPEWRGEVSRGSLALLLRHNYVPAPFSIYDGVSKLQPGRLLVLPWVRRDVGRTPEQRTYWSARAMAERARRDPLRLGDREAVEQGDALLRDAVALRMESDVPLGAFLSGGIDSSTVVALMQAQSASPVRTFSIGFHERGFDEAAHAKAVAAHLGTDHTELYVTPQEAFDVIPRLPALFDEPFSDSSQIPTFLVSQMTRQHVTVALSGDAGDELFAGYNRYVWAQRIWQRVRWAPMPLRRAASRGLRLLSQDAWDGLFRGAAPLVPARFRVRQPGDKVEKIARLIAAESPAAMYRLLVSHWDDPTRLVPGAVEPPTVLSSTSEWPELSDFTHLMMYLDLVTYLPDDILVKVDRASMGVSLESRVPFLDHRVIEFAWRLPMHQKVRDGRAKWLLREVLDRYVPSQLIERPKMGFGVPLGAWLRGPLRDWAEALLDPRALRDGGLLDVDAVRATWARHLTGGSDQAYRLWNVLMFQAWSAEQAEAGLAAAGR